MKNKCQNCGAPIDVEKRVCPYCGSKYEKEVEPKKVEGSKEKTVEKNADDMDGCLRTILTLGLISMFMGNHHGPRPPRFPRH